MSFVSSTILHGLDNTDEYSIKILYACLGIKTERNELRTAVLDVKLRAKEISLGIMAESGLYLHGF